MVKQANENQRFKKKTFPKPLYHPRNCPCSPHLNPRWINTGLKNSQHSNRVQTFLFCLQDRLLQCLLQALINACLTEVKHLFISQNQTTTSSILSKNYTYIFQALLSILSVFCISFCKMNVILFFLLLKKK